MPFTATQIGIEIIILNKINQVSYDIAYIWNLKTITNKNELFPNLKETHGHRKQIHGYQREKGSGEKDKLGGWD